MYEYFSKSRPSLKSSQTYSLLHQIGTLHCVRNSIVTNCKVGKMISKPLFAPLGQKAKRFNDD